MAEQLAVEVNVKNVTEHTVQSSSSTQQQQDKLIYFVWIVWLISLDFDLWLSLVFGNGYRLLLVLAPTRYRVDPKCLEQIWVYGCTHWFQT